MRRAIELTANAPDRPFGAVIVDRRSGEIVAEGWNKSAERIRPGTVRSSPSMICSVPVEGF